MVDCDFPGGNIIVDAIEGNTVKLHQDLRDTEGDWFYWYFRVRGAAGRTLNFEFTKGNVIGVRGPAVSADGGWTWKWLGKESVKESTFQYTFPLKQSSSPAVEEVRFCFAMPYLERNLQRFIGRYEGNPNIEVDVLCKKQRIPMKLAQATSSYRKTGKGRDVELLHLGRLDGECDYRVLFTCRHHACEMMASYTLEGIMEAILADSEDGRWLRKHVEFMVVPFVDKDGVENGDQGKNRKPHDHNRDYNGESIYPSVKAIRKLVPEWSEGLLKVAMDLHCPHIRGTHNEVIYMVGNAFRTIWKRQREFGKILESVQTGSLVYRTDDDLPFGEGWNTSKNYAAGKSSSRWASELDGIQLVTSFEIPYANARGIAVTQESAKAFGYDIVKALHCFSIHK